MALVADNHIERRIDVIIINDSPLYINDSPLYINDSPLYINDSPLYINDSPLLLLRAAHRCASRPCSPLWVSVCTRCTVGRARPVLKHTILGEEFVAEGAYVNARM
jgi:hypothetical protein